MRPAADESVHQSVINLNEDFKEHFITSHIHVAGADVTKLERETRDVRPLM